MWKCYKYKNYVGVNVETMITYAPLQELNVEYLEYPDPTIPDTDVSAYFLLSTSDFLPFSLT